MKTQKKYVFPSVQRFVIYVALIAVFCLINCLTVEAKDRMGDPFTKGNHDIMHVKLEVVKYSLPQWLFEVFMKVVIQPIDDQPEDKTSGNLKEISEYNDLVNFRTLSPGQTIVLPPFDKSSE